MTDNILDEKLRCLTEAIATELGEILRCMVEQQIAAKQAEIDQRVTELRGLELLLNGTACQPTSGENPSSPANLTGEP